MPGPALACECTPHAAATFLSRALDDMLLTRACTAALRCCRPCLTLPQRSAHTATTRQLRGGLLYTHVATDTPASPHFSLSFRTRPCDARGGFHALEHLVLCGSRRYPLADPFAVLDKTALLLHLNASTAPDHTSFYVTGMLQPDVLAVARVLLDLAFAPLLRPADFAREVVAAVGGSDGSSDSRGSSSGFSGVVYNEMLGHFSSPAAVHDAALCAAVFGPSSPYGQSSGGHPAAIPGLTHQDLVAMHRGAYAPGNGLVVTAGELDPSAVVPLLEEAVEAWEAARAKEAAERGGGGGGGGGGRRAKRNGGSGSSGSVTAAAPASPASAPLSLSTPLYPPPTPAELAAWGAEGLPAVALPPETASASPSTPSSSSESTVYSLVWRLPAPFDADTQALYRLASHCALAGTEAPLYSGVIAPGIAAAVGGSTGYDGSTVPPTLTLAVNGFNPQAARTVRAAVKAAAAPPPPPLASILFSPDRAAGWLHQHELALATPSPGLGAGLASAIAGAWAQEGWADPAAVVLDAPGVLARLRARLGLAVGSDGQPLPSSDDGATCVAVLSAAWAEMTASPPVELLGLPSVAAAARGTSAGEAPPSAAATAAQDEKAATTAADTTTTTSKDLNNNERPATSGDQQQGTTAAAASARLVASAAASEARLARMLPATDIAAVDAPLEAAARVGAGARILTFRSAAHPAAAPVPVQVTADPGCGETVHVRLIFRAGMPSRSAFEGLLEGVDPATAARLLSHPTLASEALLGRHAPDLAARANPALLPWLRALGGFAGFGSASTPSHAWEAKTGRYMSRIVGSHTLAAPSQLRLPGGGSLSALAAADPVLASFFSSFSVSSPDPHTGAAYLATPGIHDLVVEASWLAPNTRSATGALGEALADSAVGAGRLATRDRELFASALRGAATEARSSLVDSAESYARLASAALLSPICLLNHGLSGLPSVERAGAWRDADARSAGAAGEALDAAAAAMATAANATFRLGSLPTALSGSRLPLLEALLAGAEQPGCLFPGSAVSMAPERELGVLLACSVLPVAVAVNTAPRHAEAVVSALQESVLAALPGPTSPLPLAPSSPLLPSAPFSTGAAPVGGPPGALHLLALPLQVSSTALAATPSSSSSCAPVGWGTPAHAHLTLALAIASSGWLHYTVRQAGGAYDVSASLSSSDAAVFASSEDPSPAATLTHFRSAVAWVARGSFTALALRGAKLQQLAELDAPLPPTERGFGSFYHGIDSGTRVGYRRAVLDATAGEVAEAARVLLLPALGDAAAHAACVAGPRGAA